MSLAVDGMRGVFRERKWRDAAWRCAAIDRQLLGAMLALVTDEQQPLLFGGRDVPVTTAEYGLGVNDRHGASPRGRGNTYTAAGSGNSDVGFSGNSDAQSSG